MNYFIIIKILTIRCTSSVTDIKECTDGYTIPPSHYNIKLLKITDSQTAIIKRASIVSNGTGIIYMLILKL